MHTQHANTHREYTNMRYAVQHALMQAQYACALQPPGTAQRSKFRMSPQGDFPPHVLEKVAEKPSPLGNKYKGQMAEPLPA